MICLTQYLSRSVSASIGCGAKAIPSRLQDHVVRDLARRLQVFVQQRRRHRERFAGVVEARRVGGIDGELARRAEVDAGEIADGVVVLRVAQPPRQDDARIAGVLAPRCVRIALIQSITCCRADRSENRPHP